VTVGEVDMIDFVGIFIIGFLIGMLLTIIAVMNVIKYNIYSAIVNNEEWHYMGTWYQISKKY
jgi:hypothetical protein